MILRNHTYLKVYKYWWILPILKMLTIKCFAICFKKYFNFREFYIIYIIIWWFLGWKNFTPSKLGKIGLQKMQNDESFLGEKHGKIAHWDKIRSKIILGKICLTGLSQMLVTAHRLMIKILWERISLETCMVHPTI